MPVGLRQGLVHDGFKMSCVVSLSHGVFIGHLFGLNEVSSAQLDAIDARHASGLVHQSLHVEDRLGAASTPISTRGCGIGHHGFELKINQANVINAGLDPRANQELNGHAGHARVGAHIG